MAERQRGHVQRVKRGGFVVIVAGFLARTMKPPRSRAQSHPREIIQIMGAKLLGDFLFLYDELLLRSPNLDRIKVLFLLILKLTNFDCTSRLGGGDLPP